MQTSLVLTFHGIRTSLRSPASAGEFFADRYTVDEQILRHAVLQAAPKGCCTVFGLIGGMTGCGVVFSFDDGLISDYEVAYGVLSSAGVKATFFVTAGNTGLPGYCNKSQLRELAGAGMEIASHGMHHVYLTTMSREQVLREIGDSKRMLEDLVGKEVVSYAPVGGHYRRWMYEAAREAGYRAFATMIPGLTTVGEETFLVRRNHIQDDHTQDYVSRILACDRGILARNRIRYRALETARRLLGMRGYDLLKGVVLKRVERVAHFRNASR
jgi:peptidoglycan/xylan/chitin deacetylase (PgdA/CDA1 family)